VIEDHEDLAIVFRKALQLANFAVEIVMDGAIAQQRLTEVVPVLVVLDLHLPNIPGETLLRQIRSDTRLATTRVMLATADSALATELEGKADVVLLKPVSIAQLSALAARFYPHATKEE